MTLKPLKAKNLKMSLKNNLTLHQTSRWFLQTHWNDGSVVNTTDSEDSDGGLGEGDPQVVVLPQVVVVELYKRLDGFFH